MTPRESESSPRRPRRWWRMPLFLVAAAICLGQLAPLVAGPLTDCEHCVGSYLKAFFIVPGILAGEWTMQGIGEVFPAAKALRYGSDWVRHYLPAGLITVVIVVSGTYLTARMKGAGRWIFLALLAILSAANALMLGALLGA